MVGQSLHGIGDHLGRSVLHHHLAVAVVHVDEGDGVLGQVVKEELLATQVLGKRLVVVQVVVGKVGEDAHGKVKTGDAVLFYTDGTYFHEAVLAALIHHAGEELVEGDGVYGGVLGLVALVAYVVGNGGKEAAFVAHSAEQVVQQGDGGGFAVGSGNAHQLEFAGRVSVELVCGEGQGLAAVFHYLKLDRMLVILSGAKNLFILGHLLANDAGCPFGNSIGNIVVSVAGVALHSHEQRPGNYFPGVGGNAGKFSTVHFSSLFISGTWAVRRSSGRQSLSSA